MRAERGCDCATRQTRRRGACPRDRRARLGQSGALLSAAHIARRGRRESARVSHDRSLPALAFADVADNPGGGGRGNTTFLFRAFHEAGVEDALLGIFYDPDLAAEAHRRGVGAHLEARLNRSETTRFSEPYTAPATVVALTDGNCVGR